MYFQLNDVRHTRKLKNNPYHNVSTLHGLTISLLTLTYLLDIYAYVLGCFEAHIIVDMVFISLYTGNMSYVV